MNDMKVKGRDGRMYNIGDVVDDIINYLSEKYDVSMYETIAILSSATYYIIGVNAYKSAVETIERNIKIIIGKAIKDMGGEIFGGGG